MPDLIIKNQSMVPAVNNADRPAESKQEVQNEKTPEKVDSFVSQQQDPIESQKKEKGFNIFKAALGFVKGFVKEGCLIAFFIPKLLFNLATDPVNTIKGFANGFLALGKLLFNPSELVKVLSNAWEQFKAADSDQKGQVLGRILANITTIPLVGNPLFLNARLVSSCKRFFVSRSAITANADVLSRFQSVTGSRWKTFLASRKIAKRANLQKDFERALKLEKIHPELAPKLEVVNNIPCSIVAAYAPSEHLIMVNRPWLYSVPTRFLSFIFPGIENLTGTFIRHEVKHVGQVLLAARAGGPLPYIRAPWGETIPCMPQRIWDRAYQLSPLKPGTRLYSRAQQLPKQFETCAQRSNDVLSGGSLWKIYRNRKAYMKDPLEVEARKVQRRYTGLAPAIPTPSIHNLPRLAPLAEDTEGKNTVNNTATQQENGNELNKAA